MRKQLLHIYRLGYEVRIFFYSLAWWVRVDPPSGRFVGPSARALAGCAVAGRHRS